MGDIDDEIAKLAKRGGGGNSETQNLLDSSESGSTPSEVIIDGKDILLDDPLSTEAKTSRRRCCPCRPKICLIGLFLVVYLISMLYLVVIPLTFRSSVGFQRELVFFNNVLRNVTDPEQRGLNCTTMFQLDSDEGIKLGVWHIPPVSECFNASSPTKPVNESLANAKLVVLYAHGSGSSRANRFRCEAYKVLITHLDAHVVTFDYRGFGDSEPSDESPSVQGVVNDTRIVYDWILSNGVPPERILLWGHSLGTSIAVHVISSLPAGKDPMASVLEAPFTSFAEEIPEHPMNRIYRYLPWFDYTILDPIISNPELNFDTISFLPLVRCPLMILHAIDDNIVPFRLGRKLYDTARAVQPPTVANKTQFHEFGKGYKHNYIRRAPELPHVISQFLKSVQ